MKENHPCWRVFACRRTDCPVYMDEHVNCWLVAGAACRGRSDAPDDDRLDTAGRCLECSYFLDNISPETMADTCRMISARFLEAKREIRKRDQELEAVSMEMALGLSEVFVALKKIASGDPAIRLSERSSLEIIAKLKQLVNETSENIAEIVELSHEFAIGLAEHFDVLHRVGSGDLSARVKGRSNVELLEALKRMTNRMIESVAREMADRKQAETELRESEERFRTFAEKAPIGITIMRPDFRFEYVNPTFTEIFGYTIDDIPDKDVWFEKAYPDPVYREEVTRVWRTYSGKSMRIGEIKPRILTVRCKDGAEKIINFRTVVLKDGKHFVTYADITDRAKAEAAIKHSEERYRILVENIQDGVFIIRDGIIRFANEALARMLDYEVEALMGTPYLDLVVPEDRALAASRYSERMTGGAKRQELEFSMIRRGGVGRVQVCVTADVMLFHDERVLIGTVKDITEKKRAEAETRKLEAQLQRAQKMEVVGSLAGGVAHDLNNILSGLVSYPDFLLMDIPPDSPLVKPIQTIKKSGEKAAAIVQDLLVLARRGVQTREAVDFNALVRDFLDSPECDALQRLHPRIDINTRLDASLSVVMGSPAHLSMTITNLVNNAAEAMSSAGRIGIRTETCSLDTVRQGFEAVPQGDYMVLSVTDTGAGISDEDRERIFEPFYTKKVMGRRSGTGLGMAVVWGTVKDHGGYIDLSSNEDRGTTVTLFFPVAREPLMIPNARMDVDGFKGDGESVLVVDDVPEQREIACAMLGRMGYAATAVSSGEAAVEYLSRHPADLVILDMIMDPGIDGLETFRRIIAMRPGQKAILASGFTETDRVREAQALGAGEYLKKPYTMDKIGFAVKNALTGGPCVRADATFIKEA